MVEALRLCLSDMTEPFWSFYIFISSFNAELTIALENGLLPFQVIPGGAHLFLYGLAMI